MVLCFCGFVAQLYNALYTVAINWHIFVRLTSYTLTSSNVLPILKLISLSESGNICNNTVTNDHTIPHVCRYTTLWNVSVLKQQLKQYDFCNNTF